VLGIKVSDLMKDEKTIIQQTEESKKQKPPEPPKEFVQVDKIFQYLTPMEQAQQLMEIGIKPDPRREMMSPDALPGAGTNPKEQDVLNQQKLKQDMDKHQLNMVQSDQKHKQGLKQTAEKAVVDGIINMVRGGAKNGNAK
jgi:hypothetical protein